MKQIQNINIPLYKSFIALQKANLSPRKREAIEKKFIEQYNARHPAQEGRPKLESIQDITKDPRTILNDIHGNFPDAKRFFKALKEVFGPEGVFPLGSLSEEQKDSLLITLKSFNTSTISDLSQLPLYWDG